MRRYDTIRAISLVLVVASIATACGVDEPTGSSEKSPRDNVTRAIPSDADPPVDVAVKRESADQQAAGRIARALKRGQELRPIVGFDVFISTDTRRVLATTRWTHDSLSSYDCGGRTVALEAEYQVLTQTWSKAREPASIAGAVVIDPEPSPPSPTCELHASYTQLELPEFVELDRPTSVTEYDFRPYLCRKARCSRSEVAREIAR